MIITVFMFVLLIIAEKIKKVCRFAQDYCRASPYLTLNDNNLKTLGHRTQKYLFDVEFKNTFSGELEEDIGSVRIQFNL